MAVVLLLFVAFDGNCLLLFMAVVYGCGWKVFVAVDGSCIVAFCGCRWQLFVAVNGSCIWLLMEGVCGC